MAINKYRKRILNMGKEASARILLPEIGDIRIQEASAELTSLGFDILLYQDFYDRMDMYLDYINSLPFTKNWPAENLHQYLSDPIHFAMAMVACDDADGLAAGAVTPSGDVIRAAIRMIGIRSALANVSSIFFMISPNGDHAYTFGRKICVKLRELIPRQQFDIAIQSAIGSTASVVRALIYVPVFVLVMLVRSFSLTIFALLVLPPVSYTHLTVPTNREV